MIVSVSEERVPYLIFQMNRYQDYILFRASPNVALDPEDHLEQVLVDPGPFEHFEAQQEIEYYRPTKLEVEYTFTVAVSPPNGPPVFVPFHAMLGDSIVFGNKQVILRLYKKVPDETILLMGFDYSVFEHQPTSKGPTLWEYIQKDG